MTTAIRVGQPDAGDLWPYCTRVLGVGFLRGTSRGRHGTQPGGVRRPRSLGRGAVLIFGKLGARVSVGQRRHETMNILGIGGFSHDSSATLICDGEIVAAAEEERFTRRKHQPGWPQQALDFCLARAGLSLADIDHIGFYWRPFSLDSVRNVGRRLKHLPRHPVFSGGFLLHQLHAHGLAGSSTSTASSASAGGGLAFTMCRIITRTRRAPSSAHRMTTPPS